MTDLYELYYNDRSQFDDKIRNMSNGLLLAELDDTVDFDIAQQLTLYKDKLIPSQLVLGLGSKSNSFYRKQKKVFDAILLELERRLNSHTIIEYVYLGNEESESYQN